MVCSKWNGGHTGGLSFSSRRRHTRCRSDWSSDVCSSDLEGLAFLPSLGGRSHRLDQALNLTGRKMDAAGFPQVVFGLLVTGLIRSLQADQPGQRRGFVPFQAQRGIGGIMALLFAGVVVVVALEFKGAKDARDVQVFPALALLPRLGLVGGINAIGGLLQKESHQHIGGLEDGGADQHFQLLDGAPVGFPRLEAGHQLLDFLALGEEEFWRRVFFFKPASLSARVFSTTSCAYCSANFWKRW